MEPGETADDVNNADQVILRGNVIKKNKKGLCVMRRCWSAQMVH